MTIEALSKHDFVVLVPYFGGLDHEHYAGIEALERAGVTVIKLYGCPYIDHARAVLVTRAMKIHGAKTAIFIDHDIVFDPADVFRIAEECKEPDHDIVAGVYSTKTPGGVCVGVFSAGYQKKGAPPSEKATIDFYANGGLYRGDRVGMGFTAISIKALNRIADTMELVVCGTREPVYPMFAHIVDFKRGIYYGEDFSFCERATALGLKIWIDTRIRLLHKGNYAYSMEDCGTVVPLYDALTVTPLEDVNPKPMALGGDGAPITQQSIRGVPVEDPNFFHRIDAGGRLSDGGCT